MCQIEVSFICSIGIFSDRETLELLTVSLSYENLLPRLIFTCFCFVCETVQHVFVTITNVVDSLNHIFFLLSECHPLFSVWIATHVLQFFSGTVPLNFVWLSQNALFINYKPAHCFLCFHTLLLFCVDCNIFLSFFWVELSHSSLCECHKNALRVLSLIFVWMSHIRVFIFFVWMSHKYPCVSITFKWTLHFVSFLCMADLFSFEPCVDCHTSFLKGKIHPCYLFSQFW